MKKKLKVDWKHVEEKPESIVKQYDFYLMNLGIKESTRTSYMDRTQRFLKYCGTNSPTVGDFDRFREHLVKSGLSRSTINNYCFAIKQFYKMNDVEISFPFLKPNNMIPDFFKIDDVKKILSASRANLKHCTMLTLLFECSLRATELCHLNVGDVDLATRSLYLKNSPLIQ